MVGASVLPSWAPGRNHGAKEGITRQGIGKRGEAIPLVSLEPVWLRVTRNEPSPSGARLFWVVGDRLGGRRWSLEVLGLNLGSAAHQHSGPGPEQAASLPKPPFFICKVNDGILVSVSSK